MLKVSKLVGDIKRDEERKTPNERQLQAYTTKHIESLMPK